MFYDVLFQDGRFVLFGQNAARVQKGIGHFITIGTFPGLDEAVFLGGLVERSVDRLVSDATFPTLIFTIVCLVIR